MSDESKPLFKFTMEAAQKDPSGYYVTRWDLAQKLTVIAANRDEAVQKAASALGKSDRNWPWVFSFQSIDEIAKEQSK